MRATRNTRPFTVLSFTVVRLQEIISEKALWTYGHIQGAYGNAYTQT